MLNSGDDKEAVFEDILNEIIENGRPISHILRDKGMPATSTFFKWLDNDKDKAKRYARAMKLSVEKMVASIEEDYNAEPEYTQTPSGTKIDTGWVQLQRLKIDAKKWLLAKRMPERYGDKIDVTTDGKSLENIQPPVITFKAPSDDE